MKKVFKLVQCSDHKCEYGVIIVDADINEFQNAIYRIKNEFYEEDNDEWTIDDVFERMKEYEIIDYAIDGIVEI